MASALNATITPLSSDVKYDGGGGGGLFASGGGETLPLYRLMREETYLSERYPYGTRCKKAG